MYDKAGHAVPFDTDLIESGKEIFFSGYLKNVFAEVGIELNQDKAATETAPYLGVTDFDVWCKTKFDHHWIKNFRKLDQSLAAIKNP